MSTDTKIKTLIFNKLTQEQYNNTDRVPTEFYLTPDTSIDRSEKGAANGVASLDTNGKVPAKQIPTATTSALGGIKPDGTTITVTEDGTISAAVSGEVVATKADLQYKVNKAGDTMTGNLIFPGGSTSVQFGVDSGTNGYYYIKQGTGGELSLYYNDENNVKKGLFLIANETRQPYYFNGTNGYRLLTTADLANIDYVVDYKNPTGSDPNWYRKWKSGKLEQGGIVPTSTENITFLKPFANTNYTVIGNISLTYRRRKEGDNSGSILFFPEATSFCYVTWAARNFGDIGNQNISWRAEGLGAN